MVDEDDNEDSEEATALDDSQSDPRAGLRTWLKQRADQRAAGGSPYSDIAAESTDANRQNAQNQLMASLQKSAAMMGTIGGKSADASGPEEMAKSLNSSRMGDIANQMAVQKAGDQDIATEAHVAGAVMGPDLKRQQLYQSLQMKKQANDLAQQRLDETGRYHEDVMGLKRDIASSRPEKTKKIAQGYTNPDDPSQVMYEDGSTGNLPKGFVSAKDKDTKGERDWVQKNLTQISKDKQLQDANGILTSVDDARSLVKDAKTNPGSANTLGPVLARILSHGQRINMPEIESQEGGSKATFDRIQTIINQAQHGTITGQQAGYLNQMLGVFESNAKKTRATQEGKHIKSYVALSPSGVDEDTARTYLGFDPSGGDQQPPTPPPVPQGGPGQAVAAPGGNQKTVVKQQRNKATGEIRNVYDDGTSEVVSGK